MRWLLFALAGLVALAGCIGTDGPTGETEQSTEIDPQVRDRPDEGPPTHPDPDGNGSLENASEGGFSMTHVPPGDYETGLDGPSRVLEEGPYAVAEERVVEIESPIDGATIQIGLVLPDVPADEEIPVIAVATPYFYGNDLNTVDLSSHPRILRLVDNHLPHGYAVAAIPVRGTAGNGGCMTMGGHPETVDLDRAVTWLGEAGFSDGSVALLGLSYAGWTAWEAAGTGNPYLKTIVPIGGVTDWHEYWHPNGTSRLQGAGELNVVYHGIGLFPWRGPDKVVQNALCPEAARGLAAAAYSSATGERDPTGYWDDRSAREDVLANYTGSVFVIHGLTDWNVRPSNVEPWVRGLVDADVPVKRWYGQWSHAMPDYTAPIDAVTPEARWDFAQTLHNWFAYWLEGDTSRDLGPPVQVQNDAGAWRSAWTWPGANASWTTYALTAEGTLSENASQETGVEPVGPDPGRTGPHDRERQRLCEVCPGFASEPLEASTIVSGRPRVHVTMTPTSASPGHLSAYLYVAGESHRRLAGWGTIDLRFADGGEDAEPVVPGQPLDVHLSLEPMETLVQEGQRLELVLSQGTRDSDPSESVYEAEKTDTSSTPPTGLLLHTGDGQATLGIQQVHPAEERFFTPPGG